MAALVLGVSTAGAQLQLTLATQAVGARPSGTDSVFHLGIRRSDLVHVCHYDIINYQRHEIYTTQSRCWGGTPGIG